MKVLTVVRLCWLALAILVIGWSINLYGALARPTVDWRDAAGMPSLGMIFIALGALIQARKRFSADPTALVRTSATRYAIAGVALVGLIGAVLLGLLASR
jgi:hypothetical protein